MQNGEGHREGRGAAQGVGARDRAAERGHGLGGRGVRLRCGAWLWGRAWGNGQGLQP